MNINGNLKMVQNNNFVNIRVVLDRLLRHPLLTDLNLETAIQYTLDFISAMGLPNVYVDKIETIDIKEYRGELPCDLISINQSDYIRMEWHLGQ